ncbi:MAG: DUF4363 family protein [Oscillospiraceae bacterium]|nr:DUF4363 family protein [Oscillospiraceae bacterium]
MKRMILALSVIAVLVCGSLLSLFLLKNRSAEIIEYTDRIFELYENGEHDKALNEASELLEYWDKASLSLNVLVDTDRISAINSSVYRIGPLIETGCDELTAEIESIKANAKWLYECEVPVWYNVF